MSVVPIKSLFNHLLAQSSVWLSRWGIVYTSPMPAFLSVEPSAVCQLHCPQCPCGTNASHRPSESPFMSIETFQLLLSQCCGRVHTMQFYFQGEPLLNPQLPEMIRLAHRSHIYTTCSTNAHAITPLLAQHLLEAGLDRIIVSIDGLSKESYSAYRQGGSLNQALQGLIYLRQAKDNLGAHTHIELQCLRLRTNEHEWAMFARSYRKMGADSVTLKTAQFYDYIHGNPMMPSDEQYTRYHRMEDGTYVPKNRMTSVVNHPCQRIHTGCVITVNGDVLPCCFDKAAVYKMGNIHTHTLSDIWNNDAFRTFRNKVRSNRLDFSICHNCTED